MFLVALGLAATFGVICSVVTLLIPAITRCVTHDSRFGFNVTLLYQYPNGTRSEKFIFWTTVGAYILLSVSLSALFIIKYAQLPQHSSEAFIMSLGLISVFFFVLLLGVPGQYDTHSFVAYAGNLSVLFYLYSRKWCLGIIPTVLTPMVILFYFIGRGTENWIPFSLAQFTLALSVVSEIVIYFWLH